MEFYFEQHNHVMPHGALQGKIPEELYKEIDISELEQKILQETEKALKLRVETNRNHTCATCPKKDQ